MDAQKILNEDIKRFYKKAFLLALRYRGYIFQAFKIYRFQKQTMRTRNFKKQQGTEVPPVMIISVTNECNLNCEGCYSKALHKNTDKEMDDAQLTKLLAQSQELGVATVLIAGGEPFMKKGMLDVLSLFPKMLFVVFTNGTMINEASAAFLKTHKHIIPVVSIEGEESHTKKRRGSSAAELTTYAMALLRGKGILFGQSFTVTNENLKEITQSDFVKRQMKNGSGVIFYISYVPFEEGTAHLSIKREGTEYLRSAVKKLDKTMNTMFMCFPADEDRLGGCISAGTGFVHVSPSGDIEPCPFSPYKKYNIAEHSLEEALNSKYFTTIRQNRHLLDEKDGVCALFENKEWLSGIDEQ